MSSGGTLVCRRSRFLLDLSDWVFLAFIVEIDGYYHFRDPCSYRRDRRKDFELQQHGYLVVRVLAEDIVCRLEQVLDTILAAVVFCRQQAHR